MQDTRIKSFIEAHPKLLGVLFALTLMATQVGGAAAAMNHSFSGP